MKVYKIKDATTGKFSTGGSMPSFSKKGKTWSELRFVKSSIKQVYRKYEEKYQRDCVIVEYELVKKSEICIDTL